MKKLLTFIFWVVDKYTIYDDSGVIEAINKYKFDGDLSGFILGSESSFAKFKIGLEYGKIDTNDYKSKFDGVTLVKKKRRFYTLRLK